jgi:hypothetical protein
MLDTIIVFFNFVTSTNVMSIRTRTYNVFCIENKTDIIVCVFEKRITYSNTIREIVEYSHNYR